MYPCPTPAGSLQGLRCSFTPCCLTFLHLCPQFSHTGLHQECSAVARPTQLLPGWGWTQQESEVRSSQSQPLSLPRLSRALNKSDPKPQALEAARSISVTQRE